MADHHELRDEPAVHVTAFDRQVAVVVKRILREGVAVHDGKVVRPIPWWGS